MQHQTKLLELMNVREQMLDEHPGEWAVVRNGVAEETFMDYADALTYGYGKHALNDDWLVVRIEPLGPHEVAWRQGVLAAEAEYASWFPMG